MLDNEDLYINATKHASINRQDDESEPPRLGIINFAFLTAVVMGSYVTYVHFTNSNKHVTAVMGVSYTNKSEISPINKLETAPEIVKVSSENENSLEVNSKKRELSFIDSSDNELLAKLYSMEVDEVVTIEEEPKNITVAMQKIIDESTIKANSPYLKELTLEVKKRQTLE